jgi:hypothetical protein
MDEETNDQRTAELKYQLNDFSTKSTTDVNPERETHPRKPTISASQLLLKTLL